MRNNRWLRLIVLGALVLAAAGSPAVQADPTILYVTPGGSGDCSSWASACTLQEALEGAIAGNEIWVAQGTYKPVEQTAPPEPRSATFQLASGVAVYGGFAGTETLRDQRDWTAHETVLSGDIGVAGNSADNAWHVVTGSGTDTTAVLDGFTITGGMAEGDFWDRYGGGMINEAGSPTLANLVFSGNSADGYGGGLFNLQSSPALTRVDFDDNASGSLGGGMANGEGSNPTLTYVSFSRNTSGNGGGMGNHTSHPTLLHVSFIDNVANSTGGGMHNYESNPVVTDVTFSGNSANWGGGMSNAGSSPTLTDVSFTSNVADSDGGGIYNDSGSNPTLTNVLFRGNSAFLGGGMQNGHETVTANLRNVIFDGNHADAWGGGMMNQGSASLTNVTFSGNSAGSGGGIYNTGGTATLDNCILWGNTATSSGSQLYNSMGTVTIRYSDVEGSGGSGGGWDTTLGIDGGGNIDADPLFWDPANGLYRLELGSPCIDVGDNTAPDLPPTDFMGRPRILDGDGDEVPVVDMGAYEEFFGTPVYLPVVIRGS
jgi:predicted outer membrane repeat protein